MWQYGLVDTFTAVNFIYNAGAQYSAIVIAAMADGNVTKLPSMLFEPTALLGWTCFGVGLIGFTTLGALYLFQRAERKRWQNQYDGVRIDVTASLSE